MVLFREPLEARPPVVCLHRWGKSPTGGRKGRRCLDEPLSVVVVRLEQLRRQLLSLSGDEEGSTFSRLASPSKRSRLHGPGGKDVRVYVP